MKRIQSIDDVTPDPKNANLGTERGRGMLEQSLREFGAGRSILVDKEGVVIAGNKTLEVAEELGLPVRVVTTNGGELVVVQRQDLDLDNGDRARRLAYMDNRSSETGLDWDAAQIVADLETDVDLSGLWSDEEIAELVAGVMEEPPEDPGPQIDRAEELREQWGVEREQIWEIPSKTVKRKCHRVMCGDSTNEEDVGRLGITEAMPLFTDPPYGVGYEPLHGVGSAPQTAMTGMVNDDGQLDVSYVWRHARRMVWGFPYLYDPHATGWIVWDKQPGRNSRDIVTPIEIAATTMRKGFDVVRLMWIGFYRAKGEERLPHPTQKPIGVYRPFIEAWTKKGDVLADYFVGSGPMFVAAEQTGRICYGMEIEPKYIAVTLQRLADMGLEPRLAS